MNDNLIGKTVVFLPDNKIEHYQDFHFGIGVPANIEFLVYDKVPSGSYRLSAYGYGILGKDLNAYGNGKIYVDEKDIIDNLNNKLQPVPPAPKIKLKTYKRKGKFGLEIYVTDNKQGRYTGFFKDFPNIVVEGETIKDAQTRLWNATYYIFKNLKENFEK